VVRIPGCRSRGPAFDSRRYKIFWQVVCLEQGPLSLVSTIEELLGRNGSGSSLAVREYGRGDPSRSPHDTLYPQELALTSPIRGGRSAIIVHLRTEATEFFVFEASGCDSDNVRQIMPPTYSFSGYRQNKSIVWSPLSVVRPIDQTSQN
jgi:hypothetical protein